MERLHYLETGSTDPAYNLAFEEYVLTHRMDGDYLILWQNDNTVVVGQNQNTAAEINRAFVEAHGVHVVRRTTGGGAVYHDLGNLNFTFITDVGESNALDLKLFCEPVVRTLATLGVKAEVNGRNDITIDGKKFSGNSQYIRQGRVMHHGTIMFDSDLSVVGEALRVDPTKIQTKGIRSVRSRVTNVAEHLPERVTLPEFRRILLENILRENPGEEYPLTPDDLAAVEKLRDNEKFRAWIFQILSNKCRRKLKEYTQKTVELPDDLPAGDTTEESLQVREALDRLEETERQIICLNVIGGFKSHEIGEMMQMNHNTVRSRISRGLNKMKEFLA